MRGATWILVGIAAIVAAVLLLPKLAAAKAAPPPAPAPAPATGSDRKKKTVFGQIIQGAGDVLQLIPHPWAETGSEVAKTTGQYTI